MVVYPKVLIGTPIFEGKEYCRERFVRNIRRLNYPNYDWLLVDNSRKPFYSNKLKKLHGRNHVVRVPRGNNSRDALANSMNYLRRKVLEEDYDWLLSVESDLFPPEDTIIRLLSHGKQVVGSLYHIGTATAKALCVFETVNKEGLWGTRIIPLNRQEEYFNKGLKQVHGMGVGCTLISRGILERFAFWYSSADDERMKGTKDRKHPDVYFYLDLHNAGIPVFCDTDLYVYHEYSDWSNVGDL